METKKLGQHTKNILTEMFRLVGLTDVDIEEYVKQPHWYSLQSWSVETEKQFADFMYKYFKENKTSIKEITGHTTLNKAYKLKAIQFFIMNYGWKTDFNLKK